MLYVISAIGTTFYKIGFSEASPEKRLNDLQTGCPYDLQLILLVDGERIDEANIHGWMDKQGWRVRSEWFDIKNHELFKLMFELGLKRGVKVRPVSILSNATSEKRIELGVFGSFLEKMYRTEKSSSFNTSMGTAFDDLYHEYYMYCKRYSEPILTGKEVQKMLYDRSIGFRIDDNGVYIFNMRKR